MKSKRLLLTLLMALLVPWAAMAQETLTVYDGTNTNSYVPFYGLYADTQGAASECVIPSDQLAVMAGGQITAMKFYISSSASAAWTGTHQVYLGEVAETTLTGITGPSAFTVVKTASFDATGTELTIEFDEPYTYGGGNLLIGTYVSVAGNYKSAYFYGVTQTENTGRYRNSASGNGSAVMFLPKTTFTYDPASSDCPNPKTFVASDVTAHGATMTWTMDDETSEYQFNLEYKKTTEETWTRIGLGNTRTYPLTGLVAETEYQVRIQTACDPENDKWKNLSPNLITDVACPAPTNLAVTDGSITAHGATVTWEGTSNSYVVMVGQENLAIRADFEDQAIPAEFTTTSYPWTVTAGGANGSGYCAIPGNQGVNSSLSDLTLEVTLNNPATVSFNAKVSSESGWDKGFFRIDDTEKFNISGTQDWTAYSYELTAGTHTLIWRYHKDSSGASGSDLFYVDDIVVSAGVASWNEYTTNNTTYTFENLTPNRSYQVKVKGNCGDEGYSQETTPVSFTTLPSCFAPTGLAMVAGYPTAHEVSFTWDYQTGEVFQFALVQGHVTDPSEVNFNTTWNAGENFPMWNTLSADTDWSFFLRKNCDADFSDPVYVYFHTLEACPAPTGFTAMPNSITAHTANLTWQGSSNSYQVAYRTAAYVDGLEEGFGSTVPEGWTRYNTLLTDEVLNGTTALSSVTSGWSVGTSNGVFDNHARVNIYGTSCKYWLVTPTLTVPAGAAFSFDLALTGYSGSNVPAPATTGTDDRFIVLISTDEMATWTILREWNNSGSEYVYNNIANTATGENVSFDFSAYAGQTVYVAFYGESTVSNADNNLHLDNVTIGTPVPAGEWQYMTEVTEVPCQLTGLLAERKYEATLQGDCGNEGPSTVVGPITFTTAISCPAPTALNHANVKSAQVDLSWTNGGAEDWVLAYKKTNDENFTEVNLGTGDVTIEGTTVTYTLTGLDEETAYTVKVRDNCEASIPGDGMSAWTATTSFTTMAACAVENVTVGNIGHYTATVNWDGESNKGFTVKYRTAEHVDGVEEGFGTSLPTGWENKSGLLSTIMDGGSFSTSTQWVFGTNNGVFDNHARINIYGPSRYGWLITPEMTLPQGATFSFDLALTAYSGTGAASGTCADDRFVVLVYADNAWHILREWNNEDGSQYVYNNIPTAGMTVNDIDISAYVGKTVKFAFYGESTVSGNGDNNLHIDNVTIGTPVEAGSWQENETNESPYIISGLEPGTKYDLKVAPICDETLVSEIQQFTTASENDKWFITEGNWGTAANWEPEGVPTIEQTVELRANATIESGCVAEAKSISGTGTGDNAKTLTIEDGGQLKSNSSVYATVKKNIEPWTVDTDIENETLSNGWYLITNPITANFTPTAENGFLVYDYDFYQFDFTMDPEEWRNREAGAFTNMNSSAYYSYGYLYANSQATTLTYSGNIKAANSSLYKTTEAPTTQYRFSGWYLLGNGFMCDAYVATANTGGNALPFYKMNDDRNGFEAVAATSLTALAPMEGFFYQNSGTNSQTVYITTTAPEVQRGGQLNMNLRSSNKQLDNAILVFGGEQKLGKFSFREGSSKIYMPVEGKDLAITTAEGKVGEQPVSFKAEKNGTYSLSFTSQEVSFSYLHLIDNMTGADVNLLETPSYSFEARTTDYANRFRLVFATGSSVDGDNFSFINGMGNLCIFGIEGEATVQVVDVMGRVLSSETFSGSYEKSINAAPGVYMIRLINGNDVKVQKIVVR